MLLVDAGSLLFTDATLPPGRSGEQAKINARGMVEAYNRISYDAVGVSHLDLAAGLDFLQELRKNSSFSWLSANLVDAENNSPFPSFVVLKKAGLRIGIIGLTAGSATASATAAGPAGFKTLPWSHVLPGILEKLRPQTDLVILLSNETPQENKKISSQYNDIHLIIQSDKHARNIPPVLNGNTLICQTEKQGKYLGKLEINWNASKKWEDKSFDEAVLKRQELDRLSWQLSRIEKQGDPEQLYKNKPEALNAYRTLSERMMNLEKEIRLAEEKRKGNNDPATYENRFLEIATSLADDPEIAEITMATKKKINALGRIAGDQQGLPGYTGSQACFQCHGDIGASWQKSRHGRAYQTLADKDQQFNTSCLPCHVTGISMKEKTLSLALPDTLRNVGCESCHGPGLLHGTDPAKWKLTGHPRENICLQCHIAEHDDSFDYEKDSKLIH
ncbi:MAG: hypothetical protein BM485_00935 [Desulfobulbaceae bacterium DB1]|nr:MAG: hypothetical protein BM485_00935 [Desulfobulbaceae bacterium DB1]